MQVSRSGYYAWRRRPESQHQREDRHLVAKIKAIHQESKKTYGSPRIHAELRSKGIRCGEKRVSRLMCENQIRGKQKRRFRVTTQSKHTYPVAENVLARSFQAPMPNCRWVSDITYVRTGEGWLYLAAVMDLFQRQIVGWCMSSSLEKSITLNALQMAIDRRNPSAGLLHHSDRDVQYACEDYQKLLKANQMICSMSRKGNCWDNAPMESFFHTLKIELIHHRKYETREEARRDIFEYIEIFYNRKRLHSSLGYMSPVDYEMATQFS